MNIAITGASGFIGRRLVEACAAHRFRAVSLRGEVGAKEFAGCDAVIHLAGEPVAQRWTAEARERIRSSRVGGTRKLVDALRGDPPRVLISASAIGYYGSRGEEILSETSSIGNDFLAEVAEAWEREALEAEAFGVRVVIPRIGVVLGRGGGALEKMLSPFRLGLGGRIGGGRQWMSWIHLDDLAGLIEFALGRESLRGVVNATAPAPVTNAEFTRVLASALHRPALLPVPAFAFRILLGEMSEIVLGGQRVMPDIALRAGFSFRFPDLRAALENLL